MKNNKLMGFLAMVMTVAFLITGCGNNVTNSAKENNSGALVIAKQGMFSAGGKTATSDGKFDYKNQWEETGAGQTSHVDHANKDPIHVRNRGESVNFIL